MHSYNIVVIDSWKTQCMMVQRERYGDANIRIVYTFGNGPLIMITNSSILEFKRSLCYIYIYIYTYIYMPSSCLLSVVYLPIHTLLVIFVAFWYPCNRQIYKSVSVYTLNYQNRYRRNLYNIIHNHRSATVEMFGISAYIIIIQLSRRTMHSIYIYKAKTR